MLCVPFDEVLHIYPSDTLWTVTGRSESVVEVIELGVTFPLNAVVLVFCRGSTAKIERVAFFGGTTLE